MNLLELIEHTYLAGGYTTRSDIARCNAELIAEAAICGLITTGTPRDGFGSVWRITAKGIVFLLSEITVLSLPSFFSDPEVSG